MKALATHPMLRPYRALAARLSARTAHWRYDARGSRRDLRLDFLRGLCLAVMVIDHLWPSALHLVTKEFIGTVTGAEGFVFISGLVAGIVYTRRLRERGWGMVILRLWRRAGQLYLAHQGFLLLFLVYLTVAGFWSPREMGSLGTAIWDLVTLRYQPALFDVLPMYIAFLLVTPAVLWLLASGRVVWVVAASVAVYLYQLLHPYALSLPILLGERGSDPVFPFASWQLLFFLGLTAGHHRDQIGRWWARTPRWPFYGLLLGAFAVFFVYRQLLNVGYLYLDRPTYRFWFDKSLLGPGRVANFLVVFLVAFLTLDRLWEPLARTVGHVLIPLGQHSLYVYLMHIILTYVALNIPRAWVPPIGRSVLEIGAVLLLWVMVRRRFLFRLVPR
ncbi:MAG: succinyl transferase OpgC [Chloroflexi bacterium]|nr:succinyl transferase OpgC [Chloroflexota bacterium]